MPTFGSGGSGTPGMMGMFTRRTDPPQVGDTYYDLKTHTMYCYRSNQWMPLAMNHDKNWLDRELITQANQLLALQRTMYDNPAFKEAYEQELLKIILEGDQSDET